MDKMKRISIAGLCLVAVFAFSAMAVASASATVILHLYELCAKEKGAKFEKGCGKEGGKGGYKRTSAVGQTFTTKSKTSTLDSYIPASETEVLAGGTVVGTVTCKKSSGKGEIVTPMLSESEILFESCKNSEGKVCTSEGAKAGDIQTFKLSTEPVLWLGKVLLLTYAAAARTEGPEEAQAKVLAAAETTPTAAFSCEGLSVVTTNDALGTAEGNVEVGSKKSHDVLNVTAKGGQEDVFFENEEGNPDQAFLLSTITPPGVTLPSGELTNQELKGKNEVGIFAGSAPEAVEPLGLTAEAACKLNAAKDIEFKQANKETCNVKLKNGAAEEVVGLNGKFGNLEPGTIGFARGTTCTATLAKGNECILEVEYKGTALKKGKGSLVEEGRTKTTDVLALGGIGIAIT